MIVRPYFLDEEKSHERITCLTDCPVFKGTKIGSTQCNKCDLHIFDLEIITVKFCRRLKKNEEVYYSYVEKKIKVIRKHQGVIE